MPRCKNCKEKFEAYEFNGKFCKEIDCQVKKALYLVDKDRTAKKKKQAEKMKRINKEVRELKEKIKTKQDYEKELQKIVNTFIRLRDKDKPCISCDKILRSKYDAGHFYPAGSYKNLRFNEDNIHAQCVSCNRDKHANLLEYRPRLIKRIGIERVEELDRIRNTPAHFTIEELKEMKIKYKQKVKELK